MSLNRTPYGSRPCPRCGLVHVPPCGHGRLPPSVGKRNGQGFVGTLMSMPADHVRCHGCDFRSLMQARPITLQHHLPSGQVVEGYRRFAWCPACDNITEAEEEMNAASIQSEIDALNSRRPRFLC